MERTVPADGTICKSTASLTAMVLATLVLAVTSTAVPAWAAQPRSMAMRPSVLLDPPGSRAGAAFGTSVAVDGSVAVVGEPFQAGGLAYVYNREGGRWLQAGRLRGSDTRPNDFFGGAVAISSGAVVIGAEGHGSGRVYVFSQGRQGWHQVAELSSVGTPPVSGFGISVAIGAGSIVVGAAGVAYVFTKGLQGWHQAAALHAHNAKADTSFGFSVAAYGRAVVVTDPGYMGGGGRAYVFAASGHGWEETGQLVGQDTRSGDSFGFSVAAFAGQILVGAPWHGAGTAYLFSRTRQRWRQSAEMTGRGTSPGDRFGYSVALDKAVAVAGAPWHGPGTAYVFSRTRQGWRQSAELPGPAARFSSFGIATALSGTTLVIGANAYRDGAGAAWATTMAPSGLPSGRIPAK
jgi:hypothetical protein